MKQRDISSFFGKKSSPTKPNSTAKPKPQPAAKPAASKEGGSKEGSATAKRQAADADGSRRLKRLKRSSEAGPDTPAADATAEQQDQELMDEDLLQDGDGQQGQEAAATPPAAAAAAAAAGGTTSTSDQKGGNKVSNKEATAAFKQMFGSGGGGSSSGSKAAAGKTGGGTTTSKEGSKAAAGSPQKQPAGASGSRSKQQSVTAAAAAAAADGKQQEANQAVAEAVAEAAAVAEQKQQQQQQEEQQQAEAEKGAALVAAAAAATEDASDAAAEAGEGSGQQAAAEAEEEEEDIENGEDEGADEDDEEEGASEGADDGEQQQQLDDFKAAFKQAAPKKKRAAKGKKGAASAAGSSKVEGVGTGALAAAKAAVGVKVEELITWKQGEAVPYAFLAETFQTIASTTKRLEIISCLTGAFRAILASTPADLLPTVYLCTNKVAPSHAGIELGVGDATLIKALAAATGRKDAAIKADYESSGDLGSVAAACRSAQRQMFKPVPLTIASVFKAFRDIAKASGQSSQERKKGLISKLIVSSKGSEPGYIIRSLQAKLRIGLAEQSVLVALAHAVLLHKEGAADKDGRLADRLEKAAQDVKAAYSECPSYDVLIPALLEHPLSELSSHVHFMPGIPVRPMLAKPTTGVSEVLDKFTGIEFTCEYKYDGERVQIHVLDGGKKVHIYSRNAEDMTPRYPDILSRLPGWLAPGTESIVLDGEAVAWDPDKNKILPFQVLSTRARKEVALGDVKVQVCVFAFDCLYHNGSSLLHEPLSKRREVLHAALVEVAGQVSLATTKISNDVEELEAFLNEAVDASTEGLIVKTLNDTYEPSKRSSHWLKLKKDYLAGVGDTFDVVPIGGFYGRGKRAGVFGAYLLAVYDDETESYQTISKLGTGFSEEQLVQLADSLRPAVIPAPRPYYQYGESGAPDVWFEPIAVWEVKAADLSISPLHQAARGLVESDKGISIRFPRLVRVRDDKTPEEATTAAQVADMYRQQAVVKADKAAKAGDDDDEP